MKVLMVNPSFTAGAFMHKLCNALVEQGAEVTMYTGPLIRRISSTWTPPRYAVQVRFYRWTQLRAYARGPARPLWQALRFFGHVWAVSRLVWVAGRYDVVHVHFLTVPALDQWWMRLLAGRTRLVYSVHNLLPHDAAPDGSDFRTFRRIYRTCDALVAHTADTVSGLRARFGIEPGKVALIPLGNVCDIVPSHAVPTAEAVGLNSAGPPTVLLLGEIRHNKGLDVLLHAAARLRGRGVEFRILAAGQPWLSQAPYVALAESLGVGSQVEFRVGYIEERAIPAYLRAAAVVALPYRAIDQSAVAIWAISYGRPIVASRLGGLVDLVEGGECGILVPPEDPAALADALERLLTDGAERERLGRNGRRFAETALSWDGIAERLLGVYRGT